MNMFFPIWNQERQRSKPIQDRFPIFRAGESLQQFLQHQSGTQDRLTGLQRVYECLHLL